MSKMRKHFIHVGSINHVLGYIPAPLYKEHKCVCVRECVCEREREREAEDCFWSAPDVLPPSTGGRAHTCVVCAWSG